MRPDFIARQIVDLATPAALAASDKVSIPLSPRCFSCQGKAASRALKLGFPLARCATRSRGGNRRAINVAVEFSLLSMAFPLVASRLNATFACNWLKSGYFLNQRGTGHPHCPCSLKACPAEPQSPSPQQLSVRGAAERFRDLRDGMGPLSPRGNPIRPGGPSCFPSQRTQLNICE